MYLSIALLAQISISYNFTTANSELFMEYTERWINLPRFHLVKPLSVMTKEARVIKRSLCPMNFILVPSFPLQEDYKLKVVI